MNEKAIRSIIVIMSLALLGIIVIQFYWIKWGIDLNTKNFENKVYTSLNLVSQYLKEDFNSYEKSTKYLSQGRGFMNKKNNNGSDISLSGLDLNNKSIYLNELADNHLLFNPRIMLESIDPIRIDSYLKREFANNGVDIKFDYGVFSKSDNAYIITNGNYVVSFDDSDQLSSGHQIEDQLYKAQFEIELFVQDEQTAPGNLRVFFPNKTSYIWTSLWPWMLSSIVFTGLILFCFIYTINVILRQKKVSEMRNDFINNMTHEFKTPIATISLASDSIENPMILNNPDKVKRFSGIIKEENKRMLNQVEKVLQIAVVDKKDFELKISQIDMHEVINRAAEHTRLKLAQNNGKLKVQLDATNPMIEGDLTHLSNVIHNLLDNATKYSKNAPDITIITKNSKDGMEITVADKGIGMSKESLKHIFDKFYRVHTGNLHDVKGFGLGLSYVKAIMDAHKGDVSVKSELKVGSEFILYLPCRYFVDNVDKK